MISIQELRKLVRDDRGLSTVEYVILLVLIAALAVGTWQTFGQNVNQHLTDSSEEINSTLGGGP